MKGLKCTIKCTILKRKTWVRVFKSVQKVGGGEGIGTPPPPPPSIISPCGCGFKYSGEISYFQLTGVDCSGSQWTGALECQVDMSELGLVSVNDGTSGRSRILKRSG